MKFAGNTPLKVCLLLRPNVTAGNVKVGEYICLAPHEADALGRTGNVAVITKTTRLSDIKEAGGWRALIEKNPKLRELNAAEEKRLDREYEKLGPPRSTAIQYTSEA